MGVQTQTRFTSGTRLLKSVLLCGSVLEGRMHYRMVLVLPFKLQWNLLNDSLHYTSVPWICTSHCTCGQTMRLARHFMTIKQHLILRINWSQHRLLNSALLLSPSPPETSSSFFTWTLLRLLFFFKSCPDTLIKTCSEFLLEEVSTRI